MVNILFFIMNDDKFYRPVFDIFQKNGNYNCKGLLFLRPSEKCVIKDQEGLMVIQEKKEMIKILKNYNYDVIYFFSMDVLWWGYIDYIPLDKNIIWWGWGYELYENQSRGLSPLVKIPLYKEKTKKYYLQKKLSVAIRIRKLFHRLFTHYYYERLRSRNLFRIDYFQPVVSIEYLYLKKLNNFRAKEFYPIEPIESFQINQNIINSSVGYIQIGNSSSLTNNHIDVWNRIINYVPKGRTFIIPLSYGDITYRQYLKENLVSNNHNVNILDAFIPYNDYCDLISNCSYAVYGMLRQQAVGNIMLSLRNGSKVFLYKDSILYKYFKTNGFCVFSIEEIDETSFVMPLTKEQIEINAEALIKEYNRRINVGNLVFKEIENVVKKKQVKKYSK